MLKVANCIFASGFGLLALAQFGLALTLEVWFCLLQLWLNGSVGKLRFGGSGMLG